MTYFLLVFSVLLCYATCQIPPYYVGGYFTNEVNSEAGQNLNGLAKFDGTSYQPLGGVSGGIDTSFVSQIKLDVCGNLYIAGNFMQVGGDSTGPIAVTMNGTSSWSSIGLQIMPSGTSTMKQIIHDFSVVCSKSCSYCDVYITGEFQFDATNGQALNVARFDGSTQTWDNLLGPLVHNISSSTVCNTIQVTTEMMVFVGCSSFNDLLQIYDTKSATWRKFEFGPDITDQAAVFAIIYDTSIYQQQALLVGGNFATKSGCKYLCKYSIDDDQWSYVAPVYGWIKAIAWTGTQLYVGGYFQPPILSVNVKDNSVKSLPQTPTNIPVMSISACKSGCPAESAMIGMQDLDDYQHIVYYDGQTTVASSVGGGVNGAVNTVSPTVFSDNIDSIPWLSEDSLAPSSGSRTPGDSLAPSPAAQAASDNLALKIALPVTLLTVICFILSCIALITIVLIILKKKGKERNESSSPSPVEITIARPSPGDSIITLITADITEKQQRQESELEGLVRDLERQLKEDISLVPNITYRIEEISIQYAHGISNPLVILAIVNLIETDEFRELGAEMVERMVAVINRFAEKIALELEEIQSSDLKRKDSHRRVTVKKQIVEMVRLRYNNDDSSFGETYSPGSASSVDNVIITVN
jgi:hypothetical protein